MISYYQNATNCANKVSLETTQTEKKSDVNHPHHSSCNKRFRNTYKTAQKIKAMFHNLPVFYEEN